jgi:hypothetical protein
MSHCAALGIRASDESVRMRSWFSVELAVPFAPYVLLLVLKVRARALACTGFVGTDWTVAAGTTGMRWPIRDCFFNRKRIPEPVSFDFAFLQDCPQHFASPSAFFLSSRFQ